MTAPTPDFTGLADWVEEMTQLSVRVSMSSEKAADLVAALRHAADLERKNVDLRAHILDIDAHATPYGDIPGDPGWVGMYLLTAGALHRALGKIGHTAPACDAEARLADLEREADELRGRLAAYENRPWGQKFDELMQFDESKFVRLPYEDDESPAAVDQPGAE